MPAKRMRVFAGPNGSGKTTIIKKLQAEIPFGVYVNADDIEAQLRESQSLLFNTFQITISEAELQAFFKASQFAPVKRRELDLWTKLSVQENVLRVATHIDSYLAADLAEFIRQQLLAADFSFTYETVMSYEGKIAFMQQAREKGYRVYLYFIATEDPEINISRVNLRVTQQGHAVPPNVVKDRYYKSLQHLKDAVKTTHRAYVWDNSGVASLLIAEITNGLDVNLIDTENVPNWFVKYLAE